MKKLLLLLIVFASCKKEIHYYPSEDFFKENNPREINIDDLSFEKITDSIRNGLYENKFYFLEVEDSKNIYKILPFAYTGGYIKKRNALEIVNDSLWFSAEKVSINELEKYIKLHYENNGKIRYLPDSYKRAFLKLILEPKDNSRKLKTKLLNIIQVYNKAVIKNKDSIDLNIMLHYFLDKVYPPPFPPVPQPLIIED
mgnify:CR=1 FL=1